MSTRYAAVAVLAGCAGTWPLASALGATGASMRAAFSSDRLGARTMLTLVMSFANGEEGVPEPLSGAAIRLPVGLRIDLRGTRTCARSRVEKSGAAGCPTGSFLGRGHGVVEVHAGSQTIPEEVTMTAYRGSDASGRPTIEILSRGETPLEQNSIIGAALRPDIAPYGSKLVMAFPPIPSLVGEPNASTVSISLTIGGVAPASRARAVRGRILLPSNCPAGGFPFAAEFTFADRSLAGATANIPCRRRG